jgi:hypothetical protein
MAVLQGSFAVAINQMFWAPRLYERIYHRMQNLMIMEARLSQPSRQYRTRGIPPTREASMYMVP